MNEPWLVS